MRTVFENAARRRGRLVSGSSCTNDRKHLVGRSDRQAPAILVLRIVCEGGDIAVLVDEFDPVVGRLCIDDEQVSAPIGLDAKQAAELGDRSLAIDVAGSSGASEHLHPSVGMNDLDLVVAGVGNINVAGVVNRHAIGRTEFRSRTLDLGSAGIASHIADGASGNEEGLPASLDAVNLVVSGVGDDDIAVRSDSHVSRGTESAGDRGDLAVHVDLANPVVSRVGNIDVAGFVASDALGLVETGGRADSVDEAVIVRLAGEQTDLSAFRDLVDGVRGDVGDEEVARPVSRYGIHARGGSDRKRASHDDLADVQCRG